MPEPVSHTAANTQRIVPVVCQIRVLLFYVEARQQVQQSDGARPGDGMHEWGVRGGGESASGFVLCLGCFRAAA